MSTYTLTVTRQQALTLQVACEVLARLGLGQFRDALDHLPTREFRPEGWHEDMDAIGAILSKHIIQGVDGWRHSLGISNDKAGDTANKDAWDLHCVIRHRLSWDAAIERGDIKPGEPRKWPEMMGVSYDEPMRHGKEPLARISADAAAAQGDAEDAARLDWLEANAQIAIERLRRIGSEKRVYEVASNDDEIYGEGDTLRAAIDVARAAKEGAKHGNPHN